MRDTSVSLFYVEIENSSLEIKTGQLFQSGSMVEVKKWGDRDKECQVGVMQILQIYNSMVLASFM